MERSVTKFLPRKPKTRDTDPRKVFCVGLNKTGTSSLHRYFESVGLNSIHDAKWVYRTYPICKPSDFDDARCFSDGERPNITALAEVFPEALFVLNTRDDRAWLRSRVKHVLRYGEIANVDLERSSDYGSMARDFGALPFAAIEKWYHDKSIFEKRVRRFFAGTSLFLEIDVTTMPDWQKRLEDAMAAASIPFNYQEGLCSIKANSRPDEHARTIADMEKYFDYIDTFLAERSAKY